MEDLYLEEANNLIVGYKAGAVLTGVLLVRLPVIVVLPWPGILMDPGKLGVVTMELDLSVLDLVELYVEIN